MAQSGGSGHNGHNGHHGPLSLRGCPNITPRNGDKPLSLHHLPPIPQVREVIAVTKAESKPPSSPVTVHVTTGNEETRWSLIGQTCGRQRHSSLSEYNHNGDSGYEVESEHSDDDKDKFDKTKKKMEEDFLPDDSKEGLFNVKALFFLMLWYFFSFCTLFLNKRILSGLHGDPALLGASQLMMTTTLGLVQIYLPCGMYTPVEREGKPPNFIRNMVLVGTMRFTTVVLGLVSLKFVAVSFTETIKSSAPLFTVLLARVVLGERFGVLILSSLVPIVMGLALCTAYELGFNMQGFIAALATNLTECLQNVYSKMLISGEKYKYTPAELQFYTSIASVIVQIPACFFLMDVDAVKSKLDSTMVSALLTNGVFFHMQSISAYVLMGYISPVTHSVANTVKRAFLIWLSVIVFGNPVSFLSGLGTCIVIVGVLMYNKARDYELQEREAIIVHGKVSNV